MNRQFFSHRPPSPDIHLLNDPLPERVESPASFRATFEDIDSKKKTRSRSKAKKSGLSF